MKATLQNTVIQIFFSFGTENLNIVLLCSIMSVNKTWLATVNSKQNKQKKYLPHPESAEVNKTHSYSYPDLVGLNPKESFSIYVKIFFVSLSR